MMYCNNSYTPLLQCQNFRNPCKNGDPKYPFLGKLETPLGNRDPLFPPPHNLTTSVCTQMMDVEVSKRLVIDDFPYLWINGQPCRGSPYSCDKGLPYRWSSYSWENSPHSRHQKKMIINLHSLIDLILASQGFAKLDLRRVTWREPTSSLAIQSTPAAEKNMFVRNSRCQKHYLTILMPPHHACVSAV